MLFIEEQRHQLCPLVRGGGGGTIWRVACGRRMAKAWFGSVEEGLQHARCDLPKRMEVGQELWINSVKKKLTQECRQLWGSVVPLHSTVNLGTGKGSSMLQVIHSFVNASPRPVPYEVVARRAGDIAQAWADSSLAFTKSGWKATRGLFEMCEDSWCWQKNNPEGYQ